ncbi:MAG: tRNA-guanine transglycosylase [Candidatus Moranbacteria bacterium]|nr:tRNA-guanine transglycosylase [Candidatus Moranbacteria bacterium]
MNRVHHLKVKGQKYKLPIYLPDATKAVVKSIDSLDLYNCQVKGAVINTYHLMTDPGLEVIKRSQGIKTFMNFNGLIASDSGGWQIFSLIHRNKNLGKITDQGVVFSIGGGASQLFSPEKSIQVQLDLGADLVICLDDFTAPGSNERQIKKSVERTILWAKKSKEQYQAILSAREIPPDQRPLLLAVIQGDFNRNLRAYCAQQLIDLGFDGLGFGGYPINAQGKLDLALAQDVANLIPSKMLKFALGVGKLHDIAACHSFGWRIFDCTLPTRDGRHQRLYVFNQDPERCLDLAQASSYDFLKINQKQYRNDLNPISHYCDCLTCQHYSRAYLHHLFSINDLAAYRLATIHNLRTYTRLLELLGQKKPKKKIKVKKLL